VAEMMMKLGTVKKKDIMTIAGNQCDLALIHLAQLYQTVPLASFQADIFL
jgi:hypothetical protein